MLALASAALCGNYEATPCAQSIASGGLADLAVLRALPAVPLEPCEKRSGRVSSTALVRYRCNDYSVPTTYGFQDVMVKGFVDEVVILRGGKEIARHPRCYGDGVFVADPLHYLALLEMKPGALDQAAAPQGWALPEVFQHLRHLLEARMPMPPVGGPQSATPNPAVNAAEAARQRAEQEQEAARGSRLFFGGGVQGNAGTGLASLPAAAESPAATPTAAPGFDTARRQAFVERASDKRTGSAERLSGLTSPNILQAGSIIPAAIITGIRSDLPGLVTAQVTQNVYDSPTGRILLIPQGSRLIGDYDADVAFG